MNEGTRIVELYKAGDAEESYALRLPGETGWRARSGFGSQFEPIWKVEFQGAAEIPAESIDWDALMGRAIEAYRLNDPVVTNFTPRQKAAR